MGKTMNDIERIVEAFGRGLAQGLTGGAHRASAAETAPASVPSDAPADPPSDIEAEAQAWLEERAAEIAQAKINEAEVEFVRRSAGGMKWGQPSGNGRAFGDDEDVPAEYRAATINPDEERDTVAPPEV